MNLRLHGFIFWEILGLENGVRFHGSHFGPPTPKIRVTVSTKPFASWPQTSYLVILAKIEHLMAI